MPSSIVTKLNRSVFVLCSLFLLSVCVQAQSANAPALVASAPNASSQSVVVSAVVRNDEITAAPASEPKVTLSHPPLNPEIKPDQKKLDSYNVAAPEIKSSAAPQQFQATAYSLRGRTRSGQYVRRGVIAADPRVLPLGTVVQLKAGNHSGVYTVLDTGGVIKGRLIDVWVPSTREARTFGRRSVKLVVLSYPRGRQPKKK